MQCDRFGGHRQTSWRVFRAPELSPRAAYEKARWYRSISLYPAAHALQCLTHCARQFIANQAFMQATPKIVEPEIYDCRDAAHGVVENALWKNSAPGQRAKTVRQVKAPKQSTESKRQIKAPNQSTAEQPKMFVKKRQTTRGGRNGLLLGGWQRGAASPAYRPVAELHHGCPKKPACSPRERVTYESS